MEQIEMPSMDQNWKYAVGFVFGVLVTLIIIVVLANKYGKEPSAPAAPASDAGATAAPSEPQLALPPTAAPPAPVASGTETYEAAPF
jgi:hypothetical protein